jgi:hypothetical protein
MEDHGMAELTPPTRDLSQKASALADEMGRALVGSEHLLLAMVEVTPARPVRATSLCFSLAADRGLQPG